MPPYPKFEPKVSLKRSNFVVINTGNLLHSLQVTMEKLNKDSRIEDSTNYPPIDLFPSFLPKTAAESGVTAFSAVSPSEYQQQPRQWSELNVATGSEINFCGGEVFSPPPPASTSSGLWSPGSSLATAPTLPYSAASDSETTDCESDYGGGGAYDGKNGSKSKKNYYIQNAERLEAVSEFVEQLNSGNNSSHHGIVTRRKRSLLQCFQSEFGPSSSAAEDASTPGPSTSAYSSSNSSSSRKRMIAAEKAYDMTEDDFDVDGVREKLSTFRKKRLAEKTYEFKEEEDDAENITPLPRLRTQRSEERTLPVEVAAAAAKSPRSVQELEGGAECILKPLSENCANLSSSPPSEDAICLTDVTGLMVEVPELLSPGGMVKKDQQQSSSNVIHSPRPAADQQQPPRFHAKFTRRFIELDDEMISVITDIEDDELGGQATMTGYHTVLPLEVHGSGYQAMAMISKSKAEKLNRRCVKAQQRTLDLEVFCHYMAQKLCQAAGKKYWFCNDYDVEIIDLDPESGNIICVAVVLVKATIVTKRVSQQQQQKYSISSLHRHQYQGSFKFSWNMDTAQCTVIDSEPLKEIVGAFNDHSPSDGTTGVWHPAKSISQSIQRSWGVTSGHQAAAVKCFTNDAVIRGTSLTTIIDSEHLVAIFQDNLD